ncbi:MAG: hypothetical protein ACQGVK_11520 [Myxococcota bacterium]
MPSPGVADRGLAERFWAWGGEPAGESDRLRDFRRFLLIYGAVRSWHWFVQSDVDRGLLALFALLTSLAAGLVFWPRLERRAPWLSLVVVGAAVAWRFPYTANHLYLEWLCLALVCLDGGRAEDEKLAVSALRWTAAIVLFQTGLQKALYGHYWRGDFIALMVGEDERFSRIFQWLLPGGEVERLRALDREQTGAGPYRVPFGLFSLASFGVVVAETALPALMMHPRTRRLGACAGVGLIFAIEVAALELGFALLFVNLLVLFLPAVWSRRALWAAGVFWVYALGASLGWLPGHPADWNLL